MPTVQKVVLFKRAEDGTYRARPAFVVAEPGDTVRFLNFSDKDIALSFPNGPFASGSTVEVNAGWEATVPADATAGRKPYAGTATGFLAPNLQGESSPEIIIDRFSTSQPSPRLQAR